MQANVFRSLLWFFVSTLIVPEDTRASPPLLQKDPFLDSFPIVCATGERARFWKVPTQNPYFSGRLEALSALREKFEKTPLIVLTGDVGVGKTQLAKGYAYQFLQQYDLVGWFNADETLPVQLQKFIDALNERLKDSNKIPTHLSFESLLEALSHFLKKHKVKCLLIFDNVDAFEKLTPYLQLAQVASGHILVTSSSQITPYASFLVSPFSRKDSLDFLSKMLSQVSETEQEELSQTLSDHPLALSLAAGFLHFTPGATTKTYLALQKRSMAMHPQVFVDRSSQDLDTGCTPHPEVTQRAISQGFRTHPVFCTSSSNPNSVLFGRTVSENTP